VECLFLFQWYKNNKNRPRNARVVVENNVALFSRHRVYSSIPYFYHNNLKLHWLPTRQRIHYKIATITYINNSQLTSHHYWFTTFLLGPFIPSVKDCSTPGSRTVIGVPDVSHLLLQLFGIIYLNMFDSLKLLKTHLFPVTAS